MRFRGLSKHLAVAAVAATGCGAAAAVALGAASFSDPTGDNNAAPDVTSFTVAQAGTQLTVTVQVANHQTLPTGSWINIWFDLDLNPNTGDGGDEALVRYLDDGGLQLYRWNGSELARRPTTGMSGSFTGGLLTLTAPTSALDDVAAFGVLVVGSRAQNLGDDELIASDFAPNGGRIRYVAPGPFAVSDAVGDHDAAPDVESVRVVDSKAGVITFAIATPSHTTLPADTWLELDVDIDRRRSTGGGGVEAYVAFSRGRAFVGRWDAAEDEFVTVRSAGVRARNAGGVVTLDVPRRVLDDVASFAFYVVSGDSDPQEDEDYAIDLAPDGAAWWSYKLANKPPLRLIAGRPSTIPARPRAGARFSVVLPVRRSDTARSIGSGSVTCTITVQGRTSRSPGRVAAGAARCSFGLASGARGTARGSMLVRSAGKSVSARFSFPIR